MNDAREIARDILRHLDNPTKPNPLRLPEAEERPAGAGMNRLGLNYFEGFRAYYNVNRPIPQQLRAEVALGIFLDYEIKFETFQEKSKAQGGSGFSPEDLPSDYLGFYSAVSGNAVPVILDDILKEKGTWKNVDGKPWWLDSRVGRVSNRTIDPMICVWDGRVVCATNPWPDAMRITENRSSAYWRFNRIECYWTLDAFGQRHRGTSRCY